MRVQAKLSLGQDFPALQCMAAAQLPKRKGGRQGDLGNCHTSSLTGDHLKAHTHDSYNINFNVKIGGYENS